MRVVVIGDIRLLCDGLAHYLRRVPDVTVAAVAESRADALEKCGRLEPDIALVDMAMPESMETVRQLGEAVPGTRIVGISVPEEGGAVIACAEAGVSAYVAREGSLEDLARTLGTVMRGEAHVPPRIAAALLRRLADLRRGGAGPEPARSSPLTCREEEIATLVAKGLSNKQIARELRIRLPTVKNHVHNILEKLGVKRRTQIAGRLGASGGSPPSPGPERAHGSGSIPGSRLDRPDHSLFRPGIRSSR